MLETERQQRLAIFGHSSNELKSERGTNRWRSPSFTWLHSNVQQTIGRTTYLLKCKRKALFFPRAFQLISTTNGHFTIIRVHLMAATEIPGHHRPLPELQRPRWSNPWFHRLTRTSSPVLFQEWMLPSKKENIEKQWLFQVMEGFHFWRSLQYLYFKMYLLYFWHLLTITSCSVSNSDWAHLGSSEGRRFHLQSILTQLQRKKF